MNRFLLLWSLISPGCLLIVALLQLASALNLAGLDADSFVFGGIPGNSDIRKPIVSYGVYWLLLGLLQAIALLRRFGNRRFTYQWGFTTSLVGFLIMLAHDLRSPGAVWILEDKASCLSSIPCRA
ncbi:MAG: hypothetical protein HC895_06630 [Leptolyngbyaceae cyanobacterium SM1_3_5]|nr:hypothetical protein [Leptolyngbyaceae cyanobacterium SM1_3_5]